jgi:hypothetical protein
VNSGATWGLSAVLLTSGVVALALGYIEGASLIYAALAVLVVGAIGRGMATESDKNWLPLVVLTGIAVKLTASFARFAVLEFIYGGGGDATGYHGSGTRLVHVWRSFHIPETGIGTEFVNAVTGFLYIPYVPTFLGGFLLFATIAFMGQLMLFAAFRHATGGRRSGWYALGVLFLPTIVYWPSSIGKESLMFLFLGAGSLGAARLLSDFRMRWIGLFGLGAVGSAAIRPHVALLLGGALAAALLFGKVHRKSLRSRKLVATALIGLVLVVVGLFTASKFGIDFASGLEATEDFENVLTNVEDTTSKGGSGVTGSGIRSPADFPAGFVKVLFRPFPQEANNAQALASSLEGVFLLLLFILRFIPMVKGLRKIRRMPYMVFALAFTLGFIIAFSSFNNFGLLARQRSQVYPYFVALLVGLDPAMAPAADDEEEGDEGSGESRPRKPLANTHLREREALATRAR